MTNGLTKSQDYWASIRERQRGDGGFSFAVMCRLDGGQRTVTFRDNAAAAEAFASAIKAHGVHRALAMHGYEVRNEPLVGMTVESGSTNTSTLCPGQLANDCRRR